MQTQMKKMEHISPSDENAKENLIFNNLIGFSNPEIGHVSYGLIAPELKTLLVIDPLKENMVQYEQQAERFSLNDIKMVPLYQERTRQPAAGMPEMSFEEFGSLGICRFAVPELPRPNKQPLNQFISITDCSDKGDRTPVLFMGDWLNFWHFDAIQDVPDQTLIDYIHNVEFLRGFFDHQLAFTSNTIEQVKSQLEFIAKILPENKLAKIKLEKQDYSLISMAEHRLLNPVFFLQHASFKHLIPEKVSKQRLLKALIQIKKLI
jgi:hypothetical protein